jgi:uncharacterized protein YukE
MSTTPTPDQIHVALQALRDDATDWATGSRTLAAASYRAGDASLPASTFSMEGQAVAAAYQALQAKTAALLDAGARNLDDIAVALIASATAYEADEAAHAHRLNHIY